jgi:hypothetical protein
MEMHHLSTAIMLTAAYRQGLEGGHWTVRMSSRGAKTLGILGPG